MAIQIPPRPVRDLRRSLPALRAWAVGAALLVAGTSSLQNAVANGDTRTLSFHHTHRGEDGTFTFKKDGRYDAAALEKLNWYLRDWRNDKPAKMDPQLFDILWEVYRETDARASIQIVSAYRSPETNSMLRSRSRGVAKFSQHMLGKAMDFYIPGVALADLRVAGLRLQRGGVGFYPTSGSPFVHMDTGNVRHWPRMTYDQLARVFPDGKTVHVPSNGKPLPRYEMAVAELRARGSGPGVAVASADTGKGVKNFFSGLFGKKPQDEDDGETTVAEAAAEETAPARAGAARDDAGDTSRAELAARIAGAPVPGNRPAEIAAGTIATTQLASATLGAPLPQRRPNELGAGRGQIATAQASVPLPRVITRGSAREEEGAALGYATVGDVFGPPPQNAAPAATAAAGLAGYQARRARERARNADIAFGRLFLSPSLASELYLRPPELRVFTAFVAPPREVVAHAFSRDASFGLKPGFSGPAVAYLPTLVFNAPAVALTQRM